MQTKHGRTEGVEYRKRIINNTNCVRYVKTERGTVVGENGKLLPTNHGHHIVTEFIR